MAGLSRATSASAPSPAPAKASIRVGLVASDEKRSASRQPRGAETRVGHQPTQRSQKPRGSAEDIGQRFKSPRVMNPHAKLRNVTTIGAQMTYP